MSLNAALLNAFSGLRANTRAATLISTNISNATTEGFGRRELALSPGSLGTTGGVRVEGVIRHVDPAILADRRISDAHLAHSQTVLDFARSIETATGDAGGGGALADLVNAFENALLTAASNPASTQRLETVSYTATALAEKLNTLSAAIQNARLAADGSIASQVESLTQSLAQIDALNDALVAANSNRTDTSSMLDQRQRLIDDIAEIVPLRVVPRENGSVSLFATNGGILLDGGAVSSIGFDPTNAIDASSSFPDGGLSGLTLNGVSINSGSTGMFAGGRLAAEFAVRDETGVAYQAQLDALARDLVERLGPGVADATLALGDPGLFTDSGAGFDPTNENGLSSRIALNALVSPGSPDIWRLRDGLGAAAPGEAGDGQLLRAMSAALSSAQTPGSTVLPSVARSFSDQAADFSAFSAGARVRQENSHTYLSSQNTALKEREFEHGVDTDQELQRLMQIEQHYAANARVMSVVDELMERLLAI